MAIGALLSGLQQEIVYGSSWLTSHILDSCGSFQQLYESESCCSSSTFDKEFVVLERPSAACEVGWRSVTLGGEERCLKLNATAVWTKYEANTACTHEGGELIMPKSIADFDAVGVIINGLDSTATAWQYFWIGLQQDAAATDHSTGWVWDDGTAINSSVLDHAWASGQPTVFSGASADGPEDCILYRKSAIPPVRGWYDFGCSPSAHVVCMVPYISFGLTALCWGVNADDGWVSDSGLTSGGQSVCLKVLIETAYNLDLAKAACGDLNAQLYYPTTRTENDDFGAHVYNSGLGDAKVWINIVQSTDATQPGEDWMLPGGTPFPAADIPWGASDPEPTEPTQYPGQDYVQLIATSQGGVWQDVSRMTTGSGALCVKDVA
jgi:hypothetical protein